MKTLASIIAILVIAVGCSEPPPPPKPVEPPAATPPPAPATPPPVAAVTTPAATAADIKPENAVATADALAKEIADDNE